MVQAEYYEVELPGKINYAPDVKVEVKKITPFEQKKFYSQMSNVETIEEQDKVVKNFVRGLVKCTNIEFEDLFYPDYIFLLYQIREVTYKLFPLKYYYNCPECGERQSVEIRITDLEIESLDDKLPEYVKLENLGEVPIRFKTIKDDDIVTNFLKQQGEDPSDIFMRILATELALLDRWKPLDETWEAAKVGIITTQDIAQIEEFATKHNWGVKEEIHTKCNKCGKEVAEGYNIDPASFFSANND